MQIVWYLTPSSPTPIFIHLDSFHFQAIQSHSEGSVWTQAFTGQAEEDQIYE